GDPALGTPRADRRMAPGAEPPAFATMIRPRAAVLFHPLAPRSFFAMSNVFDSLERQQLRRVPKFAAGDRVRVHFQVVEGTRRRTQVFEGVVIKRQRGRGRAS